MSCLDEVGTDAPLLTCVASVPLRSPSPICLAECGTRGSWRQGLVGWCDGDPLVTLALPPAGVVEVDVGQVEQRADRRVASLPAGNGSRPSRTIGRCGAVAAASREARSRSARSSAARPVTVSVIGASWKPVGSVTCTRPRLARWWTAALTRPRATVTTAGADITASDRPVGSKVVPPRDLSGRDRPQQRELPAGQRLGHEELTRRR
jgi:hypothetical protein